MTPKTENNFGIKTRDRGQNIGRLTLVSLLAAIFCFLNVAAADAAWYDSNWSYRKKITIDRTKVAGALTNFPILISLASDSDLANYAQDDGDDILFTSSDGTTKLDHEIESFNGTTGALVAWVRIPSLSNTADTPIYLYYGNGSCSSQQNRTGVWDSNYVMVYHLHADYNDSKGTSNGTNVGTTNATGKIADADSFNGSSQYIDSNWGAGGGQNLTTMTYSAWVNANALPDSLGDEGIVHKTQNGMLSWGHTNASARGAFSLTTGTWYYSSFSIGAGDVGTWVYLVGTYTSGSLRAYKNGTLITNNTSATGTPTTNTNMVKIGRHSNFSTTNHFFPGLIDEVRISNTVRSPEWISTEFNNQGSPSAFYALGAEEYVGVFEYRKQITIDHTRMGSSCGSSVPDFPVLISIQNDNNLRTTANGGRVTSSSGYDIIFRGTDLNQLDHEIERYDGASGTFVAWVRIPSLSVSTDTVIYMDYGNSSITSPPANPTQVWDTNYVGVWHLSESPNDGAAGHVDSTGNNGAGTPRNFQDGGGGTTNATGKIGGADYFAGDDDYVDCGNNAILNVNYVTVELWLNVNSWVSDAGILAKGDNTYRQYWMWTYGGAGSFEIDEGPYQNNVWALSLGIWEHLVLTYDGSSVTAYRNGVQENQYPQTTGTIDATAQPLLFGYIPSYYYFNGSLDEVRISRVPRDACWIETEYNNMNWPNKTESGASGFVTIGAEQASPPTAVDLLSLKATGSGDHMVVSWATAQEVDNFGFHVYRSESVGGPYTRITDRLIPGLTFSVRGRDYSYVDRNVIRGRLYYYKLEDIDFDGTRTMHGPVCVDWDGDGIPDDWEQRYGLDPAVDDSGLDPDGDGLTNLQEYHRGTDPFRMDTDGDGVRDSQEYVGSVSPGLMRGVEVIASDAAGMTLELRTESFESVVLDEGGVSYRRLRVPGYVHGYTEVVGKPELPVKGILIDLPIGKGGTLSIESVESRELSNYWIYPVPEKVVSGEGELATVSEVFFIDDASYRVNSFYPDVVARSGGMYDYRGQKKLQVFFNPFSFNPETKELIQYTRIRVRVAYVALAETVPAVRSGVPLSAPVSGLARAVAWVPPDPASAYKVVVSEEGIYRVTSAWLTAQGVSVSDWSLVRVYHLGQEIPIYQGADYIEFYGTLPGEDYGKYTKSNVYWLTTSGGSGTPLRMGAIDGTPGTATVPGTHVFTMHTEEDKEYLGEAPGAESLDRWVHGTFALGSGAGGGPTDYAVTLPGVGGTQLGQVSVLLCGLTTLAHDVEIAFNGVSLGTYQWSGFEFYEVSFSDVPLLDGANTLTLTCLSGTDPVNPDGVALDWVEVAYPRKYEANGNVLKLTHNVGYRYQIGNFTSNTIQAYDITTPTDVKRITNIHVTGTNPYTLTMEPMSGSGERTYIALSSTAAKTPVNITKDVAGNLSGTTNGADYILITHRNLGWDGGGSAQPWLTNLKAHREAQGLRVKVVNVEDIYDEFSYGVLSPQGIKDFLSYTYQNWMSPAPQYVLLVGDSAYDPKDNYGLGTINYVPTYLAQTPFMGESLTDEWYVRISGNDPIADMDIGRLPASTTAQAETMVNKIISYENTPVLKTWERNTLLVADNQVEGYEVLFELMNEDVAGLVPAGMNSPFREYLNDYWTPADMTQSMINRLNDEGALILNYSGHASVQVWAGESIFSTGDVAGLTNSGKLPFVVAMTCLNGFFGYPEGWSWPSLAEVLLRNSNNGAVAAFMSTGMTEPEGQRVLDQALFEGIFKRDYRTLGRAISYAKQELVANSVALGELGKTFLLFGDPAMKLKMPLPTTPTNPTGQVSGNSVTLSWAASTDANGAPVGGYNVYRSTSPSGPYTKVNSSLITNNQYTDNSIQRGTYYYVIRSVDSDGDESPGTLEMTVTLGARSVGASGGGGGGGCFISTIAN